MPVEPIDGDALVGTGDGAGGIRGVEDFEGGTVRQGQCRSGRGLQGTDAGLCCVIQPCLIGGAAGAAHRQQYLVDGKSRPDGCSAAEVPTVGMTQHHRIRGHPKLPQRRHQPPLKTEGVATI